MATEIIEYKYIENVDEKINYPIKEINQNVVMSKNHKKVYTVVNYIDHLLISVSTVTVCV